MEVFVIVIIVFVVVFVCAISGCCYRRRRGAVLSTPAAVVITQQSYQPNVGPYPVTVQSTPIGSTQQSHPAHLGPYPMPQPVSGAFPPMAHPGTGGYPMPHPAQSLTYPPQPVYTVGSSGMGMESYPQHGLTQNQNPPSYDQTVTGEAYQKQSPYNPNYGGN